MRKVIKLLVNDSLLNILANGILVVVLQFIVLPIISHNTSVEFFGTILTIIALKNVIMQVFGGSLNNVKLLNNKKEISSSDDTYIFLLFISICFAEVILIFLLMLYGSEIKLYDYFYIIITTAVAIVNAYGTVYYRIILNYRKVLLMHIFCSIGFLIGLLVFSHYGVWSLMFFLSELLGFIYLLLTTPLLKLITSSRNFRHKKNIDIISNYIYLITSNVITNIIIYFDRLLINPVLGVKAVTIFYVASLTGKTLSIIVTPVSGVLLSYTSKYKEKITRKYFKYLGLYIFLIIIIGVIVLNILSPFVIKIFYPNTAESALEYVKLANISISLGVGGNILNPFILSICDIKWQSRVNIFYGTMFIGLGLLLSNIWGLYGFCIASIISTFIRLMVLYLIGSLTIKTH